jgi:hypothetical protein
MSWVRSIVHGLVEEARKILFTELMMVEKNADRVQASEMDGRQALGIVRQQAPAIDWESTVDNPSES